MLKTIQRISTLILLSAVLFLSACNDSKVKPGAANDVATSIPSTASGVFLMNVNSMLEKADYDAFQKTEVFGKFVEEVKEKNPALVAFIKDPAEAGLDLTGNMGMYFSPAPKNETWEFAMIFPVSDLEKLKAAIAEATKEVTDMTTAEGDGYTLYSMDDDAHLVQSGAIVALTTFNDAAKIKAMVAPEGNGIRDNKKFADQIPTGKDMAYWMDADPIMETILSDARTKMQVEGAMAGAAIPVEGLKGNTLYGYSDFKKGKSEGELAFQFSDELKEELGDLVADQMAVNYANYLPEGNLGAAFSFGVNGKGVLNFLTKRGLDATVDGQLAMFGLSLGAIEEGITGDLAAGLYPPADGSSEPMMVAALGIKDKAFIEGLFGKAPLSMVFKKEGENYVFSRGTDMMGNEMPKFYAKVVGDALVISNNMNLFEQALSGSTNNNIKPLQEGWLGMYLDYRVLNENFDVIAKALPMNPMVLSQLSENMKYQNIETAYIVGKGEKIKMYSDTKDKDMNALKSSLLIWEQMYKNGALESILEDAKENEELQDDIDAFEQEFEEAAEEAVEELENT
jgi:hypothetical protein